MKCLLFGGGVESSLLFLNLVSQGEQFTALFIDYGQESAIYELNSVVTWCRKYNIPYKVVTDYSIKQQNKGIGKLFGRGNDHYINGRNLFLIMIALREFDIVYVGSHKKDSATDGTNEFYLLLQKILNLSWKSKIKKIVPLIHNSNIQKLCKEAVSIEPDFFNIVASCWSPKNLVSCGKCAHCKKVLILKESIC